VAQPVDEPTAQPVALPRTYRPLGARVATALAAVILVSSMSFLWVLLPGSIQAEFAPGQRLTLVLLLIVLLVVLNAMFRTSAHADDGGLTITNGYRVRRFSWPEVLGVSLGANSPWALLDLADGTTVALMAIQSSDGARARRAAQELAAVIASRTLG
jgi:hypothetical protein